MVGDVVGDMGDDVVQIGRDEIAGEKAEVGEGSVEPGGEGGGGGTTGQSGVENMILTFFSHLLTM